MHFDELKSKLQGLTEIVFEHSDGSLVPPHFHVTEVGIVQKRFIDCGGQLRDEAVVNFQLFTADDYDHRLGAEKLLNIIELSTEKLGLTNLPIEVEYQGETIGKYGLKMRGNHFVLVPKQTDCLAKDNCGIPTKEPAIDLSALPTSNNGCTPGGGCC
ncbi:MAG: DUF6428 family protein [Bacteroidota bacterium]